MGVEGWGIDDALKENSISLMELALPNLTLISHFKWPSHYKESLVFKLAAIRFSLTAEPKLTEGLFWGDTTKHYTLHSDTSDYENLLN